MLPRELSGVRINFLMQSAASDMDGTSTTAGADVDAAKKNAGVIGKWRLRQFDKTSG
ncbi:hypothetical protein GCM10010343_34720 [Streptomyces avidinii]|nr:hypothetical protein GCM10010343_34720 [Streptomyces avidinii]